MAALRIVERLRAAARHRVAGDRGFTLPELLVAMLVTSIVLAGMAGIYEATVRTNSITQTQVDATNDARVAVESLSRDLRTAVLPSQLQDLANGDAAFITGEAQKVQFYANIDNPDNTIGPSRVTFELKSDGSLVRTVQQPNAHAADDFDYQYCSPGPGCTTIKTFVLATGVDATSPLFVYFDNSGNQMATPLTAGQLADVDSIEITVSVQKGNAFATVPATTYVERVSLPNHDSVPRTLT